MAMDEKVRHCVRTACVTQPVGDILEEIMAYCKARGEGKNLTHKEQANYRRMAVRIERLIDEAKENGL